MFKKLQLLALALFLPIVVSAQSGTITGTITDASSGDPLTGATVIIESNPSKGGAADIDGNYTIDNVAAGDYTLVAKFIGFKEVRTQVTVGSGTVNVDFELSADVLGLEDVVVTGIASRSSKAVSEVAISRVDAAKLTETNSYNSVSQLLTSKVAGVSVQPASGNVGGGIRFLVRSGGGLNGNGQPVIYVDGVRIDNSQTGFGAGGQSFSTLSDINPETIESVDFLKGPAAAALYGTSGSNGVVLITTKKGEISPNGNSVNVNYKYTNGITDQAVEMEEDYLISAEDFNAIVREGSIEAHDVSVSGGNDSFRYFTSFNDRSEQGIVGQNSQGRQTVQANFDAFLSEKVTLSANTSFALNRVNTPQNDNNIFGWLGNTMLFPTSYVFTDSAAIAAFENESETNRFIGSFKFNYRPITGLSINLSAGLDNSDVRSFTYQSPEFRYGSLGFEGAKNVFNRQNSQATFDANVSYTFNPTDKITSSTVVGTQVFDRTFQTTQIGRQNFSTSLVRDAQSASTINIASEGFGNTRSAGIFIQEEINYDQTYFLTIGGRQDFASAFGNETKDIFYPKASAAVRVDKLGVLPSDINFLKLRVAYGETGILPGQNDGIRLLWGTTNSGFGIGGVPSSIGNPSIEPERVKELELGLEASFFENYGIDFTYYIQNAENSIIGLRNSPSTGLVASTSPFNIGEKEGSGYELAVNATPIINRDFQLDLTALISYSENEVTDLGDAQPIRDGFDLNTTQEGLPVATFFPQEVRGATFDANGFYTGPDIATGEEGRIALGTPYPEYQGSFSMNLRFLKNFNLYALLDYQLGLSIFNNSLLFANNFGNGAEYETLQGLLAGTPGVGGSFYNNNADTSDDITPLTPGSPEYIAAAERYAELTPASDFGYVEEADFARLREVSISYNFNDLINSSPLSQYVKSASISFSGTNLWLSSKYSGIDPEVNFTGNRSASRGQDFLTLPQARSFFATFNIGF